VETPSYS